MSGTRASSERASQDPTGGTVDMKLEVVVLPVSDVDRAKRFYGGLGWRLDADLATGEHFRVVQLTPPHSQCSIHVGKGVTTAKPGSVQNLYLAVEDIHAARAVLVGRGVDVSEPYHFSRTRERVRGPDPEGGSYATFAGFTDPDGNSWLLQEVATRLPGRTWPGPVQDVAALTDLLGEAEKRHGEYEPTAPKHHWSGWYAAFIAAREQGSTSDEAAREATRHVERAER